MTSNDGNNEMDLDDPQSAIKRGRGRPKAENKSLAIAKLIEVTESLLENTSHHELTERKIAAAADCSDAMIHYYFGGKDGLLFEVMLHYYESVREKLKALDSIDPYSPTVTRDIFKIMMDAYYHKYWIARMVIAEFARGESAFKDLYMNKFGVQGVGLARLRSTLERLIACGVYDGKLNPDYIGLSIFSMLTGPFITGKFLQEPFYKSADFPADFIKNDSWLNHVADLFDRQLRGDLSRPMNVENRAAAGKRG